MVDAERVQRRRSAGTARPKRWILRDQVGLWLLGVTAGPLLLLAWLYPSLESRNIRALQRERMEATAETTASALDQFLLIHLAAVEYLADQFGEPRRAGGRGRERRADRIGRRGPAPRRRNNTLRALRRDRRR